MCTLTIDCRCDTCIDGITRYQWPRIIAVQAPPSIAAELRKLATVSAMTARRARPRRSRAPAATIATRPAIAADRDDRRTDRRERPADGRPVEAAIAALERDRQRRADADRADRRRSRSDAGYRNASAMAIRTAASPALKRKNFTPASRETNTSVNTMPTPRWARKRKRTVERDRWAGGQVGW